MNVAILGGGPAGAFCAIWLARLAREGGSELGIRVFDYKSFEKPGPAGCNMCAGIIPDSLIRNMSALGLHLPEHVIQQRIEGYVLQTRSGSVDIPTPAGTSVCATFRGPGPLGMYPAAQEGFDWFLLGEAERRGAEHISTLVTDVRLPESDRAPFQILCRDGSAYEADVVVGAFGVNSNLASVFERLGIGYRAPRTLRARQAEMPLEPDFIRDHLRNRVLIFAMGWPGVRFAAVTPKRQHVTVTIIDEHLDRDQMETVLSSPALRAHLPPGWQPPRRYCSCAPRLPVSAARNPIHDRLLMIGDANISRYLKNGIESSFYTAMWAARAILSGPPSREHLRRAYLQVSRRTYLRDNAYGRLLLRLQDLGSRSSTISRALIEAVESEQRSADLDRPLADALWGMFTGAIPYRRILAKGLRPKAQFRLAKAWGSIVARRLTGLPVARRPGAPSLGPIGEGQTVIIIGGGPAGASCAISLVRGTGRLSRPPKIVLIEGKRFGEHQNQCAGVLSPPGTELVSQGLGVPLPANLLQRRVKGYVLHGARNSAYLSGEELGEISFALRRVELDQLLLEEAKASGVRVVHARATDLEITAGGVVVYTESGSLRGDAVVGAFALDEGMARAFSRRTRYRPPRALETLACKIHPAGLDFIPNLLDDCIHVFLPRQRGIDFGALIPKGNHIVVVIAGARLGAADMEEFLAHPRVSRLIPRVADMRGYFKGAFPLGPARGLYGDRYAVIGDAAGLVRPFKGKGIDCALEGGRQCAAAMLGQGISRQALAHFARSQRHLARDVWYGRLVRWLVAVTSKHDLLDPFIEEAARRPALRQTLFDCVSGRTTYRDVVLRRENLGWMPAMLWRCLAHQPGAPHRR